MLLFILDALTSIEITTNKKDILSVLCSSPL